MKDTLKPAPEGPEEQTRTPADEAEPARPSVAPSPALRPFHLAAAGILIVLALSLWYLWRRSTADSPRSVGASASSGNSPASVAPAHPYPPEGMVYVPGGTFIMGQDEGDEYERPAHRETVGEFFIDRFEVTCDEYQRFVDAKNHRPPPGWKQGKYPAGSALLPVTGVSWGDANAYAEWIGKRLPTEKEWEFAARGTDRRLYPWGNEWRPEALNALDGGLDRVVEVGLHPEGASPFGAFDMVGNAWEWTEDSIRAYPNGSIREDTLPDDQRERQKVIRGGCYMSDARRATATYRRGWPEQGADYSQTGFRCAKSVEPQTARN
ncbi:MAG: SUMF1/EgtB/PvdO family nonheme iron enzyme [Pyrinomonadaceae bacterium]